MSGVFRFGCILLRSQSGSHLASRGCQLDQEGAVTGIRVATG
jgi:hypothetical protein